MPDLPIVVVPSDDPPQCQGSPRLDVFEGRAEVRLFTDRASTPQAKVERVKGATAIINSRSYVEWREADFEKLPDLKFITVCGIGTDSLDLEAARARGITVSNIPGRTLWIQVPARKNI